MVGNKLRILGSSCPNVENFAEKVKSALLFSLLESFAYPQFGCTQLPCLCINERFLWLCLAKRACIMEDTVERLIHVLDLRLDITFPIFSNKMAEINLVPM